MDRGPIRGTMPKGGHGTGGWGKPIDDDLNPHATEGQEGDKDAEIEKKTYKSKVEVEGGEEGEKILEDEQRKKEEEEEAKTVTLSEYLEKQKVTKQFKKEARKPEENKKLNVEKVATEKEKVATLNTQLKSNEVYNVSVGQSKDNQLLAFQGEEEYFERRGRGGFRGGRGAPRGGAQAQGGARKGRG